MHGVVHKLEEVLTVANADFQPWRSSRRSMDNIPVQLETHEQAVQCSACACLFSFAGDSLHLSCVA